MIKISSADFWREPELYQGLALAEPVIVTRDGRDEVVVISAAEFGRLRGRDRVALSIEDFAAEEIDAVRRVEPSLESEAFDHELDAEA